LSEHLPTVLTEIRSLLDQPAERERAARAHVEKTMTDGYAHALSIGTERLRVEGELRGVVRAEKRDDARIAELTTALHELDLELAGLRGLLAALRAHAL
jgi:hypothetical protein